MANAWKTLIGLVIFLAAVAFPFWYNAGHAATPTVPDLDPAAIATLKGRSCVEPTDYMRSSHMVLLEHWRNQAVRDGDRTYVASDGVQYEISLEKTCLGCHADGAPAGVAAHAAASPGGNAPAPGGAVSEAGPQFCTTCHAAGGVPQIDCWSCHVATGEVTP